MDGIRSKTLAKLVWLDPFSGKMQERFLHEGWRPTLNRALRDQRHTDFGRSHIAAARDRRLPRWRVQH